MRAGDRVHKSGWAQSGVVREVELVDGAVRVLVWWGTAGLGEVLEWVDAAALASLPYEVKGYVGE